MVDADRQNLNGLQFRKMTGSGNNFVFLLDLDGELTHLENPATIARLCERGTGIGADGVVWIRRAASEVAFQMRYRNSDGSLADMCGNAALCSISLAVREGIAPHDRPFAFLTDAGVLGGRLRPDGLPEVAMGSVLDVRPHAGVVAQPDELRVGYAESGVPHLVVEVRDAERVPLPARGRVLRFSPEIGPGGANVNFISKRRGPKADDLWRMRTYERGVEGETLACGTGAVACAVLLQAWGLAGPTVEFETTSGRSLLVSTHETASGTTASLAGEGRLVFSGVLVDG